MHKNDTETIVKEFLDLWQKQCAYMAKDGDGFMNSLAAFAKLQQAYADSYNKNQQQHNQQSGYNKSSENQQYQNQQYQNSAAEGGNQGDVQSFATHDVFDNISREFGKLKTSHAEFAARLSKLEDTVFGGVSANSGKTAKNSRGGAKSANRKAKR